MPATPKDKVVVITGASRGLGLEWTNQYAAANADTFVIAVVRNSNKASQLDPLVAGGKVALVEADMSRPDTFDAAAAKIGELGGGKVDVLINNAGAWTGAGATTNNDVTASTPEEWTDAVGFSVSQISERLEGSGSSSQFAVNTIGPVFFVKALLPLLERGSKKQVVNISTFGASADFHIATGGQYGFVSYGTAKAALNFATLKYHLQLKDKGYTFITLNPGYVQTDLTSEIEGTPPLTPEQSVTRCKSFVDRLTTEESGGNFSLDGSKEPLVY